MQYRAGSGSFSHLEILGMWRVEWAQYLGFNAT
jgi:hypothetical protein